jgi:two-component system, NtrC family, response regulator PilR
MTPPPAPEAPPAVLIVDDDTAQREALVALLGAAETASRVGEARVRLAKEKFEVIVLDVNLPDGKGTELLPYVGPAAVILVSGEASAEFRTIHPSVQRRAVKPYDPEIMVGWVGVLSKMARLRRGRSWTPKC